MWTYLIWYYFERIFNKYNYFLIRNNFTFLLTPFLSEYSFELSFDLTIKPSLSTSKSVCHFLLKFFLTYIYLLVRKKKIYKINLDKKKYYSFHHHLFSPFHCLLLSCPIDHYYKIIWNKYKFNKNTKKLTITLQILILTY